MATVTPVAYLNGAKGLITGSINWASDTIKCALVGSGYTPDQDNHDFFDDIGANELAAGGGYATGGATLSGKSSSINTATNVVTLTATGPSWTNITGTFKHLVIYKSTGTAGTSPLIAVITLGTARTLAGDNYTLTVGAGGLFALTVSA